MSTHPSSAGDAYRTSRLLLVISILILLLVIVAGISGLIPGGKPFEILAVSVATVLLILCVFEHVVLAFYAPTRRKLTRGPASGTVNLITIRDEYGKFANQFDNEQITQYARSILYPSAQRARIVEEISPQKRTLRQRVSTILNVSTSQVCETLLFAALTPVKGELQDDLKIYVDDSPVATLTHREYLVLTCMVLEALLVPTQGSLDERETKQLAGDTDAALRLMVRRGQIDAQSLKKMDEYADRIASLAGKAGGSLLMAAALLRKLANNYAIVVEIPPRQDAVATQRSVDKRNLSYERFIIPALQLAPRKKPLRALHDRLGALLGARPVQVRINVANAASTDSYHLFVMGPEGTYVGWQDMPDPGGIFRQPSVDEDLCEPYARLQRRKGQRYLHLYTRSIPESMADKLNVDIGFYEVPPGSMAGASLAAGASFVLIFIAALIMSRSSVTVPITLGSDFPALVLAFPAVAGALVGFETRTSSLVGGTLSSKASSFLTIILSLGASGLFMAQEAESASSATRHPIKKITDLLDFHLFGIKNILGVETMWWQILTVVALFNLLYALYIWTARTASFYWLAYRPDE